MCVCVCFNKQKVNGNINIRHLFIRKHSAKLTDLPVLLFSKIYEIIVLKHFFRIICLSSPVIDSDISSIVESFLQSPLFEVVW